MSDERARYDRIVTTRIRTVLLERKISIAKLAEYIGASKDVLYSVFEHKTSPSLFTVAKICRVLDLDANKLLGIR